MTALPLLVLCVAVVGIVWGVRRRSGIVDDVPLARRAHVEAETKRWHDAMLGG